MNHLFDKVFADTRAEDARKAGIYPYFHRLESRQDAVVVMEGKRPHGGCRIRPICLQSARVLRPAIRGNIYDTRDVNYASERHCKR